MFGGRGARGAEAFFPALGEDIEVSFRIVGVGARDVEVELEPEAGRGGQREVAVGGVERGPPRDEIARPRVVEHVEVFLDEEIRHAGGELQADGGGHRAAALVRRDVAAVRLRETGDGEGGADAAE